MVLFPVEWCTNLLYVLNKRNILINKTEPSNITMFNLGRWCLVMWSYSVCDACWCLSLWGPCRTEEFPQDAYCEWIQASPNNHFCMCYFTLFSSAHISNFLAADSQRPIRGSWFCPSFNGVQTSAISDLCGKSWASNSRKILCNENHKTAAFLSSISCSG